jgi:hypothetical protein
VADSCPTGSSDSECSASDNDGSEDKLWEDITSTLENIGRDAGTWQGPDVEFKPRRTGPVSLRRDRTELEAFTSLITTDIVKLGVTHTNLYGESSSRHAWKETYDTEFTAFIGVLLYMGAKGCDRSQAWLDEPWGDQYMKTTMTWRRFTDLFSCLHFVENDAVTSETQDADCFWRLRPFIDRLVKQFGAAYVPGQFISVDEATTAFKGRHRAKQYNPKKPAKWGFKTFAASCSKTGYVFHFHLYQGRDQARLQGQSMGEFAVLSVLPARLNDKGYIICADNWFTSATLTEALKGRGFHYCGTARQGRKGQPSAKIFCHPTKAPRGSVTIYKKKDTSLYATVWRDSKDVRLLTTFPAPLATILRRPKGRATKTEVTCPAAIGLYNANMGGVDRNDQATSYIKPDVRSRRPTRSLFIHFITMAAYNARVLFCISRGKEVRDVSMRQFVRKLSLELIEPYRTQKQRDANFITPKRKWTKNRSPREEALASIIPHYPVGVANKDRRRCRACTLSGKRKDVRQYCKGCGPNAFLCLDGPEGGCWTDWHTGEDRF